MQKQGFDIQYGVDEFADFFSNSTIEFSIEALDASLKMAEELSKLES